MTLHRIRALGFVLLAVSIPGTSSAEEARGLRFPDIHGDTLAFAWGGDLWLVAAAGGEARRITTGDGLELFPRFSPDGRWIAFTGHYDGSSDVYVIPSEGGEARRLTWFPARVNSDRMGWDNMVLGWTPEGKVLFRSQRGPIGGFVGEPWVVDPRGGPAERFPLPESGVISFSPDGKRIAYNRIFRNFRTWKRYRGGMAQDVWIHDLASGDTEKITAWEGTDSHPMWVGESIYFVSDREDSRANLWRFEFEGKSTSRVTGFADFDVKWPECGTGKIVFECGGFLWKLDPAVGEPVRVSISLRDDGRYTRRRWVDARERITEWAPAPGGRRAVFVARGDVFTVPAEHGVTRNLTLTQGVRERAAAWSPDGRWIACISDASGEDGLVLLPPDGKGSAVEIPTGATSRLFRPVWSPDSKKIAIGERAMTLRWVDVESKVSRVVDRAEAWEISQYSWSPDSKWLAWGKTLDNGLGAIFLHGIETGTTVQATGGAENCAEPVFDPSGDSLYFLSDRDIHPMLGRFELSFTVNRMTRPYALLLRRDSRSPFEPPADEVLPTGGKEAPGKSEGGPQAFRIDLDGLSDRILGFPVPPGEYRSLGAAKGRILYISTPLVGMNEAPPAGNSLRSYELGRRKESEFLPNIDGYEVSSDGSRLLWKSSGDYGLVDLKEGLRPLEGRLELGGLRMEIDPRAEWTQIFHEVWRLERDYFYVPDLGGLDWKRVRERYAAILPSVGHRNDLTYLLGEMIGELGTGHAYVGGGDEPRPPRVPVGCLGADLVLDRGSGAWRISRILLGQNWIESRRSPLSEPGVGIAEGDYLFAIDGRPLGPDVEPSLLLVEKAQEPVTLLVGTRPKREDAREVQVRTIAGEADLRYHDWVERNRREVERATAGRAGYIHIPDMQARGLQEFVRQYFPQVRKQGLIVDVRFNGGGFVSQIILERLRRVLVGMSAPRSARPDTVPDGCFHGPMVALLNQYSASDGDLFPHYFRKYGLGPLIGRRSWGGVIGIRGMGELLDGGYVTVPEFGNYGAEGRWILENEGVQPDIIIDNPPREEFAGKDVQLERAVEEILRRIDERRPALPPRPASPDLRPPAEARGERL